MVSPLCSYNHITEPHTSAAKMEKYRESGGIGFTTVVGDCDFGAARGMNDAITREQMYSTTYLSCACKVHTSALFYEWPNQECERTCSLTALLSPKTI